MSDLSKFLGLDRNSTPTPQAPVNLDPQSQALLNAQSQAAMRPSSEFTNELNKGLDERTSQIGDFGNASQAQTGMSPGMRDALRNAYSAQTGDALDRIKLNNSIEGQQRKSNALALASHYALQQQQITKTNYFQTLTDAYNQMEAQRAQFVSSLTGLANYGIGTYEGSRSKNVSPGFSPDQAIADNKSNIRPTSGVAEPMMFNGYPNKYNQMPNNYEQI